MGFDPVPWAIDGALTPAALSRAQTYATTNGATGVVLPDALKVVALPTPTNQVRILPGPAVVASKYDSGLGQSYVIRNLTATDYTVPATGSASGATRYVIARVSDPEFGDQAPEDLLNGPYVWPEIVSDLTRLNFPYILLAQINQPANTATITQNLIVDKRQLVQPRSYREVQMEQVSINQDLTSTTDVKYPNTEPYFKVPEWATHAFVQFRLSGIAVVNAALEGWFRAAYGPLGGQPTMYGESLYFDFNAPAGGNSREEITVSAKLTIPEADRGQMRVLRLYAHKAGAGILRTHNGTQATADIQFYERPI